MEDLYNKIINGEVDIKYLSPIDLTNLLDFLEEKQIELNNQLNDVKIFNSYLTNKKEEIKQEISKIIIENEIKD